MFNCFSLTFRQLRMSTLQRAGSILKLSSTACIATVRSVRATPVERSRLRNVKFTLKLAKYRQAILRFSLLGVNKVEIRAQRTLVGKENHLISCLPASSLASRRASHRRLLKKPDLGMTHLVAPAQAVS